MKKQYKIFGLILALALLVCSVVALSASAEDTLAIEYANVAYNKMTQLAFTIKGTPADGAEVGLAYWGYDVTGEKTLANATLTFENATLDGKTYWLTPGIPASEMSKKVTVAPVTKNADGSVAIAGALFEYGIYDYVNDRLADNNVTDKQMKLYTNLVKYGNSAEKVINKANPTIPYVIAENGEFASNGKSLYLASAGDKLTLRANTINADGDYFLYWTAPDGSKIYDRVTSATAGAANATYVANYCAKADSAYGGNFSFDALAAGQLSLVPSTIGTPALSGGIYTVTHSKSFLNGALELAYAKIQVVSDTDLTVVKTTDLSIKEENGNKYIFLGKAGLGGTQYLSFYDRSGISNERIEVEMTYNTRSSDETTALHFFLGGKDCRIDTRYESNGDLYLFKNGTKVKVYAGNFKCGEKFTVTAEVNEKGFVVVSVNGVVATKAKDGSVLLADGGFSFNHTAGVAHKATKFQYESYSYDSNTASFYTVNFVDTDKFN